MPNRNHITLAAGLVLFTSALAFGFWPQEKRVHTPLERVPSVQIDPVLEHTAGRFVRFSGVTRSERTARLSFSVPARMVDRRVTIGDRVNAGQLLARLDTREFENAVAAAAATTAELNVRLIQAKRDQGRMQRLTAVRAATPETLERSTALADALSAAHQAAVVRLNETRRLLSETKLTAPFDGTVTAVMMEAGEWASPGRPVVEISGHGDLELEVEVPESVMARLHENAKVTVELPLAENRKVTGCVHSLARAATAPGRLFPVVIRVDPHPGLMPGMTAELIFELPGAPLLTIPLAAIVNPGASFPRVFRVVNDRTQEVTIVIDRFIGQRVAVKGGLVATDRVIVSGHTALTDGQRVKVIS
jgi:RND family efflux transporter MFP subunit